MQLEVFKRQNGAVVARLFVGTSAPTSSDRGMPPGSAEHRLGKCCLPAESLSPGFVDALERDGWAIAAGNDRALLLMVTHAVSHRASHVPGQSLIETAIDVACRSIQSATP